MLIEMLESEGIAVVSANTDGVVMKCPRAKLELMDFIVWEWEHCTGFETEATEYAALYSRDVNNYIAIKKEGVKLKGVYALATLQKNPSNEVVTTAVIQFLQHGTSVEQTILQCKDLTQFVTIRTVKGGALDQSGAYLGKAVRWVYATNASAPLRYKVNGYTVARSEGAMAMMEINDQIITDGHLDFAWYIREAHSILKNIGATP